MLKIMHLPTSPVFQQNDTTSQWLVDARSYLDIKVPSTELVDKVQKHISQAHQNWQGSFLWYYVANNVFSVSITNRSQMGER